MKNLTEYVKSLTNTPQSAPIPGSAQVPNSGGGYSWAVDDWVRLDRFMILGSEGGTYYIQERELTRQCSFRRRLVAVYGVIAILLSLAGSFLRDRLLSLFTHR